MAPPVNADPGDESVLAWLSAQQVIREQEKMVLECVNRFVIQQKKAFVKITASQWGQIRAAATQVPDMEWLMDRLFNGEAGLLMHGVSQEEWLQKGAREKLKSELGSHRDLGSIYAVRLASAMQKNVNRKGQST